MGLPPTPSTVPDVRNYLIRFLPRVLTCKPFARPAVFVQALVAYLPDTAFGVWVACTNSPWSVPFPPSSPPTLSQLCSMTSQVIWDCTTPCLRSSSSYSSLDSRYDPSITGRYRVSRFSREVFPYVHGVSDHAGLLNISL